MPNSPPRYNADVAKQMEERFTSEHGYVIGYNTGWDEGHAEGLAEAPAWTPVSPETMPPDDKPLLLWHDGGAIAGQWSPEWNEWWATDNNTEYSTLVDEPTHWMPMPLPPAPSEATQERR